MLDDMLNLIQILDVIQIHAMKIHTVINIQEKLSKNSNAFKQLQ